MCAVRKGISIILGILMLAVACIGVLPVVAYAAPGEKDNPVKTEAELNEAIKAAAEKGGTIYVASIPLAQPVEIKGTKGKISIIGVEDAKLTLGADNPGRHFAIGADSEEVEFRNLTIKGPGIAATGAKLGGGVAAEGGYGKLLSFYNCAIEGNVAAAGGGVNAPAVYMENCLVEENAALAQDDAETAGGAVYANSIKLVNTTVYGNQSDGNGGGLAGETIALINTTMSANIAGQGAAIYMLSAKYPEMRGFVAAGNYNTKGESSNVARKQGGESETGLIMNDILEPAEANMWTYVGPLEKDAKLLATEEIALSDSVTVTVGKLENGGILPGQQSPFRDAIAADVYATWFTDDNATAKDKDIRGKNRVQNVKVDMGSVEVSVPGLSFSNMPATMLIGSSVELKFNIEAEGADYTAEEVVFTSSMPDTLKVEGNTLTALKQSADGVDITAQVEQYIVTCKVKIIKANIAALTAAVTEAEKLKEADYTEATWTPFAAALSAAKAVVEKQDATEEEITKAITDLNAATQALIKNEKKYDREKLDSFIDVALELEERKDEFTEDSWAKLEEALKAAQKVKDDEEATEEAIHTAAAELKEAIDTLEAKEDSTKYDREALKALADEADKLVEAEYTAASWKNVKNMLALAKVGLEDESTTDERINLLGKALKKAMSELVKKGEEVFDKAALAIIIKEAEALKQEEYTPETWEAMKTALKAAQDINAKAEPTDEELNKAGRDLRNAMDALKKTGVDKGALDAAITKTQGLKEAEYTAETWAVVKTALEAAKTIQAKNDATQEDVDSAATALNAAINGLIKKDVASKTNLQAAITKAAGLSKAEYTDATWAAMITALNNANFINTKANATQTEVDDATKALNDAIAALVKVKKADVVYPTIGTWNNANGGSKAKDASGNDIVQSWGLDKSANIWYYFDKDGNMIKGKWLQDENRYGVKQWFYLKADGKMATGWNKIDNSWYYFSTIGGNRKDNWTILDGEWYYLGNDGKLVTNWLKYENQWYYLKGDGKMARGYMQLTSNGVQRWFDFDLKTGAMDDQLTSTGWLKSGNEWIYSVNGKAATGWQLIDSEWYYFSDEGYMQTDWQNISYTWYYLKPSGAMATEWVKYNGEWYYLTPIAGYMVNGEVQIDGAKQVFTPSGKWIG